MVSSVAVLLVLVVCCRGLGVDEVPPRTGSAPSDCGHTKPNELTALPECSRSRDCPNDRTCEAGRCQDPCLNVCGRNTVCRAAKHVPVCSCIEGFMGDPLEGCTVKECTRGNTTETNGKKKFKISSFKINWFEAFSNCQSRGLRLATLESKEDFEELVVEINNSRLSENLVWVGANDLGREGQFFWMTTGQPVLKYRKWSHNQPDNCCEGGEHCMEIWREDWQPTIEYGMNDRPCTKESFFVCEHY